MILNQMTMTANQQQWLNFDKGAWTKNYPSVPGTYFVKMKELDTPMLLQFILNKEGRVAPIINWNGFIWSNKLPMLPPINDNRV